MNINQIKLMNTYVVSFHYSTKSGMIIHFSCTVFAKNEFEAQKESYVLSKEFRANYNAENPDDSISQFSNIQFRLTN